MPTETTAEQAIMDATGVSKEDAAIILSNLRKLGWVLIKPPTKPTGPDAIHEAYAKGWEDACSLAMARFGAFTECTFYATEAIQELERMIETGAHHPENRADGK